MSYYDNNHPMYKIMCRQNDVLIFLDSVAEGRNKVGHVYKDISNNEINNYASEIFEIQNDMEKMIKIFLEGK